MTKQYVIYTIHKKEKSIIYVAYTNVHVAINTIVRIDRHRQTEHHNDY
jgi:hypothetical protein